MAHPFLLVLASDTPVEIYKYFVKIFFFLWELAEACTFVWHFPDGGHRPCARVDCRPSCSHVMGSSKTEEQDIQRGSSSSDSSEDEDLEALRSVAVTFEQLAADQRSLADKAGDGGVISGV